MKAAIRRLGVVALAALFLSACSAEDTTVLYEADYPAYDSADALFAGSKLVIEGRLTGLKRVMTEVEPEDDATETDPQLNPNAGATPDGATPPAGPPTVMTVSSVEILRVHKGLARVGQVIQVKELGGTLDGVTYEEADTTPLRSGVTYMLFLETYPDSPASLLNPEQAKYVVTSAGTYSAMPENSIKLDDTDVQRLSVKE
ncbi:hypothetical protein MTP10_29410 [Nonomuraea sp. 3-1Str]|uniref:hypothetical protein n=1 Tax=Nonomuraea sp. 3-1Str TaxID=2929801 RepID=UPI002857B12F|nr:hypothetical protein [Nonomuraea sp. 3-1Str]MDR8412836.1 hypothetical protein [Nonomuraea sp. 3-1Str]